MKAPTPIKIAPRPDSLVALEPVTGSVVGGVGGIVTVVLVVEGTVDDRIYKYHASGEELFKALLRNPEKALGLFDGTL